MSEKSVEQKTADRLILFEDNTRVFHTVTADTFLALMREINTGVEKGDPSGWGIYGFDSSKVSPSQVQDIGAGSANIEPDFEIHYFPSTADNEVAERRQGELITFISDKNPDARVNIEFLPMNSDKITFSEAVIQLPIPKTNYHIWPSIISVIKHDEDPYVDEGIVLQGVAPSRISESITAAGDIMAEVGQIVDGINQGKYHMRVFGSSANSPMEPRFILQQGRLSGPEQ